MNNLDRLSQVIEEDKAKEILKLTDNFDKYVKKFKDKLNGLLDPLGYQVKLALVFDEKEKINDSVD